VYSSLDDHNISIIIDHCVTHTDTIVMIGFRLLHPRTTVYFQNGVVGCVGDYDPRGGLLAAIQLVKFIAAQRIITPFHNYTFIMSHHALVTLRLPSN
jgi:hypothetical protein